MLIAHLHDLYAFYGPDTGVRVARKHISWYTKGLAGSAGFRHAMNQLPTCETQLAAIEEFFDGLEHAAPRLRYIDDLHACEGGDSPVLGKTEKGRHHEFMEELAA